MLKLDSFTLPAEIRAAVDVRLTVKDLDGALRELENADLGAQFLGDLAPRFLKLLPENVRGTVYQYVATYKAPLEKVASENAVLHLGDLSGIQWEQIDNYFADFWEFPLSGCGSYSGSSLEEANRRYLTDKHAKDGQTFELLGGFFYKAFAVYVPAISADLVRLALSLENYSSLEDEYVSTVETEREDEYLDNGGLDDFKRELIKLLPDFKTNGRKLSAKKRAALETELDELEPAQLSAVFYHFKTVANEEFRHETGESVYIPFDSIARHATAETLRAAIDEAREEN